MTSEVNLSTTFLEDEVLIARQEWRIMNHEVFYSCFQRY